MPSVRGSGNAEPGGRTLAERSRHPLGISEPHTLDNQCSRDQLVFAANFHLCRIGLGLAGGRRPELHARDAGLRGQFIDQRIRSRRRRECTVGPEHHRKRTRQIPRASPQIAYRAHHAAERGHDLLRPGRRVLEPLQVGRRGQHIRAVHLVEREEAPVAARNGLVAPAEAKAGHADAFLQMLAVVPALEVLVASRASSRSRSRECPAMPQTFPFALLGHQRAARRRVGRRARTPRTAPS